MKKTTVKKLANLMNTIKGSLSNADNYLDYLIVSNPKECKDALERSQLKESLEEAENEMLKELWVVSQNCLRVIKAIDKETLREFQEDSEVI